MKDFKRQPLFAGENKGKVKGDKVMWSYMEWELPSLRDHVVPRISSLGDTSEVDYKAWSNRDYNYNFHLKENIDFLKSQSYYLCYLIIDHDPKVSKYKVRLMIHIQLAHLKVSKYMIFLTNSYAII